MERYITVKEAIAMSGLDSTTLGVLGDYGIIKIQKLKSWRRYEVNSVKAFCKKPKPKIETFTPDATEKPHDRTGLLNVGELAGAARTSPTQISVARKRCPDFPEPTIIGQRKYWREDQVDDVRRVISEFKRKRPGPGDAIAEAEANGYYTIRGAGRYLDMPEITVQSWLHDGSLSPPKYEWPNICYKFYKRSELDKLRKTRVDYFNNPHAGNQPSGRRRIEAA